MRANGIVAALVVLAALVSSTPAEAAKCTISTSPITFGPYNVFSIAPVDSVGSVLFNCQGTSRVSVGISAGQSGTFQPRALRQGTESLAYNLFLDASRSIIWGNGTGGTQTYIADPGKADNVVSIYGRIEPEQDVSHGAYADSVTVTVNF